MMIFKLFFAYLMISNCSAEMFETLYKSQGDDQKATACCLDGYERRARACHGILWRLAWLVVRASCLKQPREIYVHKGNSNCTHRFDSAKQRFPANTTAPMIVDSDISVRHVGGSYQYSSEDLAILRLDWAYSSGSIDNRTLDYEIEKKLDVWVELIGTSAASYTTPKDDRIIDSHYLQMYTTPIRMFLITVILPTVTFIVVFQFVIFFTGSSEKTIDIPYTTLTNEGNKNNV